MREDDFFKDFDRDFAATERTITRFFVGVLLINLIVIAAVITLVVLILEHFKIL